MDTNGSGQMKIWNDAIKEMYTNITLRMEEYRTNVCGSGHEWQIATHCMDIVEKEAQKLWKQC